MWICHSLLADSADVLVTCPAAWDAKGCDMMREAAIAAGLVQSARAGDVNWRNRLRIITYDVSCMMFFHLAHTILANQKPQLSIALDLRTCTNSSQTRIS